MHTYITIYIHLYQVVVGAGGGGHAAQPAGDR